MVRVMRVETLIGAEKYAFCAKSAKKCQDLRRIQRATTVFRTLIKISARISRIINRTSDSDSTGLYIGPQALCGLRYRYLLLTLRFDCLDFDKMCVSAARDWS